MKTPSSSTLKGSLFTATLGLAGQLSLVTFLLHFSAAAQVDQRAASNALWSANIILITNQVLPAALGPNSASAGTPGAMKTLEESGNCVEPPSGLVSWWQAENDASDAVGSNPGTPVGDVPFATGMVGQAFSFDQSLSQSVQIPYATNLATPSFTFETWVYPSEAIDWQAFIYGQAYGRQLVAQAGDEGLWIAFHLTDPDANWIALGSDSQIPIGSWTHLAATWDGTSMKLYINGELNAAGTPEVSGIGDSGCAFCLGGVNDACGYYGQYFPGLIDEMSAYNCALTAEEVSALYQAGSAGKCTPLTPLEAWLQYWFGSGWRTNPDAAPGADHDHDGLTNFQEYNLGTNPTQGAMPDNGTINLRVYTPLR
jgi:hypothetical protein